MTVYRGEGGKVASTHTVAYPLSHGPIPEGLNVLHSCDTRHCCNPAHLSAGTQTENSRQMGDRGRTPQAVVTPALVYGLRLLRQSHGLSWKELARSFGLSGHNGAMLSATTR